MFDWFETLDIEKVKKFWAIATVVLLSVWTITFSFIVPFGYRLETTSKEKVYQYQDLTKDDLTLESIWIRIPFDNQQEEENYRIGYADYADLSTTDYIKKYQVEDADTVGEQVVVGNEEGRITIILPSGRSFTSEIPMIKAKSVVLGYEGNCKIGDIVDPEKIYMDVTYEDKTEKRFTGGFFSILDTDDLVLKQGFNNFTVSYAGETFPLSISCTEGE